MKPKPPLESVIQRQILDYLTRKGYFVWRQNQGGIPTGRGGFRRFNGMRGLPDICGVLPDGHALFIEVKRPRGKTTPEQNEFLIKANLLGAHAFVARSVKDIETYGL